MTQRPKFVPKAPQPYALSAKGPQRTRNRPEDSRGGQKRPREELHSSAHVRHSAAAANKKRRVGTGELLSLPIVMSTSVVNARKAYYDKFRKLIGFELDDEMKDVEDRLLKWSEARLRHEGVALFRLAGKLAGSMYDDLIITFTNQNPNTDLPFHRFAAGDIVLISRYGASELKRYEGSVLSRNPKFLKVVVSEVPSELEANLWRIDKGANRVAHDRMKVALDIFTSNNHELDDGSRPWAQKSKIKEAYLPQKDVTSAFKKIIMDEPARGAQLAKEPSILTPLHLKEDLNKLMKGWRLNDIQANTIRAVLTHRLSLIQGPPGTGKTHTAIHLLRLLSRIYRDESIPILATAYTNVAVDNLLEGLRNAGIDALRLGRVVKVREELRDATLQARIETHPEYPKLQALRQSLNELVGGPSGHRQKASIKVADKGEGNHDIWEKRKEIRELEKRITADIIRKAQVICCTCIGAGDPILDDQYFPLVVLDESTQAVEPATLVPLVKGAQHVIMLGDHYQLPPTVKSDRSLEGGLRESLFERLVKTGGLKPYVLLAQYRMHPTLSRFPSAHFYSNQLTDAVSERERPVPRGFKWNQNQPLAFIDFKSPEQKSSDGHSKTNPGEAALVVDIVRAFLVDGDLTRTDIGIISPYAGQVKLLHELFSRETIFTTATARDEMEEGEYAQTQIAGGLNVASVDGFQGREKQLIVFSCVRSNPAGRVGFLADWRRLNVAITRAKRGLIVVGDSSCLISDPHWKRWMLWVNSQGCCFDSNFNPVVMFENEVFDPTPINDPNKLSKPQQTRPKEAKAKEDESDSDSETPVWVRFDSRKAPRSLVDIVPPSAQTILVTSPEAKTKTSEVDAMDMDDKDKALSDEVDHELSSFDMEGIDDIEGIDSLSHQKSDDGDEKEDNEESPTITSSELDAIIKMHRARASKKAPSPEKKTPEPPQKPPIYPPQRGSVDLSPLELSRSFDANIPEYVVPDAEVEPINTNPNPTPDQDVTIPIETSNGTGVPESNDPFMTRLITTPRHEEKKFPFAGHIDLNDSANDIMDPVEIVRMEKSMQQGILSVETKPLTGSTSMENAPSTFINIDKDPTSTPINVSSFPEVLPLSSQSLAPAIDVSGESEATASRPPKLNELTVITPEPTKKRSSVLDSSSDDSDYEVDDVQLELELDPPRSSAAHS